MGAQAYLVYVARADRRHGGVARSAAQVRRRPVSLKVGQEAVEERHVGVRAAACARKLRRLVPQQRPACRPSRVRGPLGVVLQCIPPCSLGRCPRQRSRGSSMHASTHELLDARGMRRRPCSETARRGRSTAGEGRPTVNPQLGRYAPVLRRKFLVVVLPPLEVVVRADLVAAVGVSDPVARDGCSPPLLSRLTVQCSRCQGPCDMDVIGTARFRWIASLSAPLAP